MWHWIFKLNFNIIVIDGVQNFNFLDSFAFALLTSARGASMVTVKHSNWTGLFHLLSSDDRGKSAYQITRGYAADWLMVSILLGDWKWGCDQHRRLQQRQRSEVIDHLYYAAVMVAWKVIYQLMIHEKRIPTSRQKDDTRWANGLRERVWVALQAAILRSCLRPPSGVVWLSPILAWW